MSVLLNASAAKKEVHGSSGILVFDDVVIDKSWSGKMELVNWQYASSKHDITKGIGVVNALWQVSKDNYVPMDYRIWNPPEDGKTKNDHFQDMLSAAKQRDLHPEMVVADSWNLNNRGNDSMLMFRSNSSPLLFFLAGCESHRWHPLVRDFIAIGQKLEQLGSTYYKGIVTVIDPSL